MVFIEICPVMMLTTTVLFEHIGIDKKSAGQSCKVCQGQFLLYYSR
jgi:hypothetical protein